MMRRFVLDQWSHGRRLLDHRQPLGYALRRMIHWRADYGRMWRQRLALRVSLWRELTLHNRVPILVYQMARVGSQAVYDALHAYPLSHAYHLHVLAPELLHLIYPRTLHTPRLRAVFAHFQREAAIMGAALQQHMRRGGRVKLITPIRDPIARNVSLFFHMLWVAGRSIEHLPVDTLTKMFLADTRHATAVQWFDRAVQPALGLDVYRYPFPSDAGYTTIGHDQIEMLIYQAELADAAKERILAEFLSLDQFTLGRTNGAERTPYAQTYRRFIDQVRLPAAYVEAMCRSRYMQHFYSAAARDIIRRRWLHH